MIEPKQYTYLTRTLIGPDAIEKALMVVQREIDKLEGPTAEDARWYMDVIRGAIVQKDKMIALLRGES